MWSWWGSKDDEAAQTGEDSSGEKAKEAVTKGLGNIWSAVSSTVGKVKTVVSQTIDSSVLGEFDREQKKFLREKNARRSDAAVPPWVGYHEEEAMKSQILTLSSDKRNFLRNPPQGALFHFDFNSCFPVAEATLAEDPNLKKMRFELVPKIVTEETFWRNYFYRVSLIKQSTQLTSLTNATEKERLEEPKADADDQSKKERDAEQSADVPHKQNQTDVGEEAAGSPTDEFISDGLTHQEGELSQAELGQLGVERTPSEEEPADQNAEADWEKDLQQELEKFGVKDVDTDEAGDKKDDGTWEAEIEQMLELEDDDT